MSEYRPAYTAVVRCGCDGGGKGALVATDVSMTITCASHSTMFLFQPLEAYEGDDIELRGRVPVALRD